MFCHASIYALKEETKNGTLLIMLRRKSAARVRHAKCKVLSWPRRTPGLSCASSSQFVGKDRRNGRQ